MMGQLHNSVSCQACSVHSWQNAYHNSSRNIEGCHLEVIWRAVAVHGSASNTAPRTLQFSTPLFMASRLTPYLLSADPNPDAQLKYTHADCLSQPCCSVSHTIVEQASHAGCTAHNVLMILAHCVTWLASAICIDVLALSICVYTQLLKAAYHTQKAAWFYCGGTTA